MTNKPQLYVRPRDNWRVLAIQYGGGLRTFDAAAITEVVGFLTGVDPDDTTISNERILDVATPNLKKWTVTEHPLVVVDPDSGMQFELGWHDWIVRDATERKDFVYVTGQAFKNTYLKVDIVNDLANLMLDAWKKGDISDGETAMADVAAKAVLGAGWILPTTVAKL